MLPGGGHLSCRARPAPCACEWVTMPIVTREGDRRCDLRPSQRAMVALVYLCEHTTLAKIAAVSGSGSASPPPKPAPARSSSCSPPSKRQIW
jgi:hypothetical protein